MKRSERQGRIIQLATGNTVRQRRIIQLAMGNTVPAREERYRFSGYAGERARRDEAAKGRHKGKSITGS